MIPPPSEQAGRFSSEVTHLLLATVEQAIEVLRFCLVLGSFELLLLSVWHGLLLSSLRLEVLIHGRKVALFELGDFGLIKWLAEGCDELKILYK